MPEPGSALSAAVGATVRAFLDAHPAGELALLADVGPSVVARAASRPGDLTVDEADRLLRATDPQCSLRSVAREVSGRPDRPAGS